MRARIASLNRMGAAGRVRQAPAPEAPPLAPEEPIPGMPAHHVLPGQTHRAIRHDYLEPCRAERLLVELEKVLDVEPAGPWSPAGRGVSRSGSGAKVPTQNPAGRVGGSFHSHAAASQTTSTPCAPVVGQSVAVRLVRLRRLGLVGVFGRQPIREHCAARGVGEGGRCLGQQACNSTDSPSAACAVPSPTHMRSGSCPPMHSVVWPQRSCFPGNPTQKWAALDFVVPNSCFM